MSKPHYSEHKNPIDTFEKGFTHYIVQSVREYETPDGQRVIERVTTPEEAQDDYDVPGTPVSPVFYSIYGRDIDGESECLIDRKSLREAMDTLRMMGVV